MDQITTPAEYKILQRFVNSNPTVLSMISWIPDANARAGLGKMVQNTRTDQDIFDKVSLFEKQAIIRLMSEYSGLLGTALNQLPADVRILVDRVIADLKKPCICFVE